jgi:RimJ/RimL family protein N-acetyltransferase
MNTKIKLRALTQADMEKTLAWHNQDDISSLYSGHPFPVNIEMERLWYEKILTSNFPTTVFGIELVESKELIGITVLRDIHMINRTAEIAIYIGNPESRGKGFSKDAMTATLIFGFLKLSLNRIHLKVLEENSPAIKLYQSLGFIKEGILRNSIFKNGEYKSEMIFSILKNEFIKAR